MRRIGLGLWLAGAVALVAACDADTDHGLGGVEHCLNGEDDDGDGLVDCDDADCALHEACQDPYLEVLCDNGVDDDGDGQVDCEDPDCRERQECLSDREVACADQQDNDGDGLADCRDPDCQSAPACQELCGDGVDNDLNGYADCLDPACVDDPDCAGPPEDCVNGVDDDGDGKVDCIDPECKNDPGCPGHGLEICDDEAVDNDGDGLVNCADPDCADFPGCSDEACADGEDNDGDGLADCDDPDCVAHASCFVNGQCQWHEDLACGATIESTTVGRVSNFDSYGICDPRQGTYGGGERIYRYESAGLKELQVTLISYATTPHRLMVIRGNGLGPGCAIPELSLCWPGQTDLTNDETVEVLLNPGDVVYIVVDGVVDGAFDLLITCEDCFGVSCEGECVNLEEDPANCGDCGWECADAVDCIAGVCGGTGYIDCGGSGCIAGEVCCTMNGVEECLADNTCTSGGAVVPEQQCDGPEDCFTMDVCCFDPHDGDPLNTACVTDCPQTAFLVCTTDAWCANHAPPGHEYCCPVPNDYFNVCFNDPNCSM